MASKNRVGGKPGADRAAGGKTGGGDSKQNVGGKSAGGGQPGVVFPFPAAELLAKGLEALGFPEGDVAAGSVYRPVGLGVESPIATLGSVRGRASSISLFNRYIRELELFNSVFDLVGAETGSEQGRSDLVVRHILDSLAPWKEIASLAAASRACAARTPAVDPAAIVAQAGSATVSNLRVEIADVGSGAGFPGIPLAVVFPDFHFTLVERMSKRCAFLENCVAMLGLKNVTVLNAEVEKAPAGAFDIVAFRAFRPLDRDMTRALLALTREGGSMEAGASCTADGASGNTAGSADGCTAGNAVPAGKLAAWKARRDKIEVEMSAIADELDGWRAVETPVPFLDHEERHLVITSSARNRCQPR